MRSLWFKLSAYFSVLIIVVAISSTVILNLSLGSVEFYKIITPELVTGPLRKHRVLIGETIKGLPSNKMFELVEDNLMIDLNNLYDKECDLLISEVATPRIFLQILDESGREYYRNQSQWSEYVQKVFNRPNTLGEEAMLIENGRVWVSMPLHDLDGYPTGRLRLLYSVDFERWKLIDALMKSFIENWVLVLIIYSLLGFTCGFLTDRLVPGRLKKIDLATSSWREGNFVPRIQVPGRENDILDKHSRALNAMADDLEGLFELKQKMAVAEERGRMARELHDTVKQNLFALSLQITSIKNKNSTPNLIPNIEEAQKITREAQQDIMEILTQLRPLENGPNGLIDRISDLGDNMFRRFKATVVWDKKDSLTVTPDQKHALIRIAQEAMNNAVKHGLATAITLSASTDGLVNTLSIADNGSGLGSESERAQGSGLTFMRERVKELPGGDFSINNLPGGGAMVTIRWDK